jgi:hypothetical protein
MIPYYNFRRRSPPSRANRILVAEDSQAPLYPRVVRPRPPLRRVQSWETWQRGLYDQKIELFRQRFGADCSEELFVRALHACRLQEASLEELPAALEQQQDFVAELKTDYDKLYQDSKARTLRLK